MQLRKVLPFIFPASGILTAQDNQQRAEELGELAGQYMLNGRHDEADILQIDATHPFKGERLKEKFYTGIGNVISAELERDLPKLPTRNVAQGLNISLDGYPLG